jgi:hypothetical protein
VGEAGEGGDEGGRDEWERVVESKTRQEGDQSSIFPIHLFCVTLGGFLFIFVFVVLLRLYLVLSFE